VIDPQETDDTLDWLVVSELVRRQNTPKDDLEP